MTQEQLALAFLKVLNGVSSVANAVAVLFMYVLVGRQLSRDWKAKRLRRLRSRRRV